MIRLSFHSSQVKSVSIKSSNSPFLLHIKKLVIIIDYESAFVFSILLPVVFGQNSKSERGQGGGGLGRRGRGNEIFLMCCFCSDVAYSPLLCGMISY